VSAALIVAAGITPPVGAQEIPLATMATAHLNAPAAPAIAFAPKKFVMPRQRLLASSVPKLDLPAPPALIDAPVVLVRTWQVTTSPSYYVIAVVFFEPPPPMALHGI
jgi:hypothetical protein